MKHPLIFVTGTDTGIGKTVTAAALVAARQNAGQPVVYWKPVQTGDATDKPDAVFVEEACGGAAIHPTLYTYPEPLSPDQAALAAGRPAPDADSILAELEKARRPGQSLIVEGAGGLLVPLNEGGETWADLLCRIPGEVLVVLVARSGLGTLNHTGLSLEALRLRVEHPVAVVLQGEANPANEASLRRMHPGLQLTTFPWLTGDTDLQASPAACADLNRFLMAVPARGGPGSDRIRKEDQSRIWHPYTQHKTAPDPGILTGARGVWLERSDGQRLVDGISSWWVNTVGHGRTEIGEAMARQQRRMDHVIFAGATHAPATELGRRIIQLSGDPLSRVFFSDNGSCAVEIALKMAIQSRLNRGQQGRHKFLTFRGSYHGDTFGAMAAGTTAGFHGAFAPFLWENITTAPVTMHPSAVCPRGEEALEDGLAELDELFAQEGHQLAGVLIEPLVQGASGMNMQVEAWLVHLAGLARRYDIPLILDEVFTGMGRIGAAFAFQRCGIRPDIICLAKGLTGGNLPLALTLASEEIFRDFLQEGGQQALLHGHSYTANPIACAAALATLDIYEQEDLINRGAALETRFQSWIDGPGRELGIAQPRARGAILAFELPGSGTGDYFNPLAAKVPAAAARHGLFLRPLGNTVYLAPPLSISEAETDFALDAMGQTLTDLRG